MRKSATNFWHPLDIYASMRQDAWHMGTMTTEKTFGEKFEDALREARERDPQYGLRTLARSLAKDDAKNTKTILRRLQKYRPKPGGGAAEVTPTEPTRREIERHMGLEVDSLRPDVLPVEEMIAVLMPSSALRSLIRQEMRVLA